MTHYQVLGVHQDASAHAIKQAFRKLALIHHPDRNPNDIEGAQRRMQVIAEAYDVLSDPVKRREYDRLNSPYQSKGENKTTSQPKSSERTESYEDEKLAAEFLSGFRRKLEADASRFESKDAFLGIVITFLFCCNFSLSTIVPTALAIFFTVVAGLLARALARHFYLQFRPKSVDRLGPIIFVNFIGAILMTRFADLAMIKGTTSFLSISPLAAMLSAIVPSLMGAGFGRAFTSVLGELAGIIGGSIIAAVIAFVLGMWTMFFQAANPAMLHSDGIEITFKALLVGSICASSIGALKFNQIFLYSILESIEGLLDRFRDRPSVASNALTIYGKK